jgi:cytochrome c551/c552
MHHVERREWSTRALVAVFALGCAPTGGDGFSATEVPGGVGGSSATGGVGGSSTPMNGGVGGGGTGSVGGTSSVGGGTTGGTGSGGTGVASGGSGSMPPVAGSGGAPAIPGSDLPCDVQRIIEANCVTCHGTRPAFGAPMSLMQTADFAKDAEGLTVGKRVVERINDDQKPMPPPPNPRLSDADRSVLETWIGAGSPAGTCDSGQGSGGAGGTSGAGGSAGGPPTHPPDVTCYQLTARASSAGDKYPVPTTPDLYQCFEHAAPWGDKTVQVVSARPIIDNPQVLHHWILYNTVDAVNDGTNGGCSGAHPNAAFITGWAPGGDGLELPADVGLRTEGGGFSLEIHYNNTQGSNQLDGSGVEVCVTEKLRPKEAAVHWLGTQNLNKVTAIGTCEPLTFEPVTIISSSPHMHLQGRHMKTVINRANGGTDMLIDVPFDFNTQVSYSTPAVINPGDTLTTTCTYATPTPFGQKTNEEMCYNFVVAYPAGGLAQFLQILRKYDCTGL